MPLLSSYGTVLAGPKEIYIFLATFKENTIRVGWSIQKYVLHCVVQNNLNDVLSRKQCHLHSEFRYDPIIVIKLCCKKKSLDKLIYFDFLQ